MADTFDIKCNYCDKKLEKHAKFCGECGERVISAPVVAVISCKKCEAPISAEHKFCPSCGEKVLSESDSSKSGSSAKATGAVVHKPDVKTTQTNDGQCLDDEITKPHTETTKPLPEYTKPITEITKPDNDKCVDDNHDADDDDDDDDDEDTYFESISNANDQNLSSNDNVTKQKRVKSRRYPPWYKELDFKTGYQGAGDCCLLVEFYVLINEKMWNEKPDVYLRFECKELEDKTCYGPLEVLKKFDGQNVMMHFSLHIPKYLFRRGIKYKYICINQSTISGVFHHYELIEAEHSTGIVNRYLFDNSTKDFHHLVRRDGIIVPQHLSKDENRIIKGIKNIFFRSHQPQDHQRSLSLIQYYLFEYNLNAMKSFTDSTAQKILGIYNDLKGSLCFDDHAKITPFVKYYQQELCDWISEVVSKLCESKYNVNLSCATVVAVIVAKANLDISKQTLASLLRCLTVNVEKQNCPNYTSLCTFFSSGFCKEILSALYQLCNKAIAFSIEEFILAIPLMHFLSGTTAPFEKVLLKKQLNKKLPIIAIDAFRVKQGVLSDQLLNKIVQLKLMTADCNLASVLADCLSLRYLELILKIVPTVVLFSRVLKELSSSSQNSLVFKDAAILRLIIQLCEQAKDQINDSKEKTFMAECAIGILSTIISAESHLYFIEILPSVVNLVDQELKMIAEDSQLLNKRTFEISDVIQCYVNIYTKDDSKPKYSLECEVLIHLFQKLTLSCSSDRWIKTVESIAGSRIGKLKIEEQVDFLQILFSDKTLPQSRAKLKKVAMKSCVLSFQKSKIKPEDNIIEKVAKIACDNEASELFDLLTVTLLNEYSEENVHDLSMKDLLSWRNWPQVLKVWATLQIDCGDKTVGTTEKAGIEKCNAAFTILKDICNQIKYGTISIEMCKMLCEKQHNQQLKLLFYVIKTKYNAPEDLMVQLFELHDQVCRYEVYKENIQVVILACEDIFSENALMELKKVEETDGSTPVVSLTFTYIDEPFIKEFPRYFKNNLFQAVWKEHIQLHKDGKLISIETVDDDQCDTASSNKDITNGQEITESETDESETDNSILSNEGITSHQDEETTESKTVSEIEHINSYFWDPVISKCKVLITGIQDCSISLSVVIKYFGNYEERNSFIQLANPLAEKIDTFSAEKFTAGIESIISYKSFLNCKDVANAFLNMKKMLKLTGNFESFESISNPINMSFLKDVTPELVYTAEALYEIAADESQRKCLNAISRSQELLCWLQTKINDFRGLSTFIQICTVRAATEGDDILDQITKLNTLGLVFHAIIYDLPENCNADQLNEAWKAAWIAQQSSGRDMKRLSVLWDDCQRSLNFYKSMEETSADIEKSAYKQFDVIREHGIFRLQTEECTKCVEIHDAFQCIVACDNLKKYSLDEIRELQSKLSLIGSYGQSREHEVDNFLQVLQLMCGIGILLIKLKGSGHAKYLEWSLDTPCSCIDTNLRKLESIVQSMQDDLSQWNCLVQEMRFKYHALNYFTNKQLLLIRRQLGEMKMHPTLTSLSYDIKMLLASVSHPVEESRIKPILYEIATDFEKSHKAPTGNKHSKSHEDASDTNSSSVSYEVIVSIDTDKMSEEEKDTIVWLRQSFSDSIILEAMKTCGLEDDDKVFEVCGHLKADKEKATVNTELDCVEIKKIDEPKRVKISEDVIKQSRMPELYSRFDPLLAYAAESLFPDDFDSAFLKCVRENESIAGDGKHRNNTGVELHSVHQSYDDGLEKKYLGIEETGYFMEKFSQLSKDKLTKQRLFSAIDLKAGMPNLIITAAENVFATVLSLYMMDETLPLPSFEEVLVCNENTTAEEVSLLWQRSVADPQFKRIFCLVYAEKLSFETSQLAVESLKRITQDKRDYRLVIVCSSGSMKSHAILDLHQYKRNFTSYKSPEKISKYIHDHFVNDHKSSPVAHVDISKSTVRVVASHSPGTGKSLYIKHLANKIKGDIPNKHVIIPIHSPDVSNDSIVTSLLHYQSTGTAQLIHFDISPSMLSQFESFLFNLLILKALSSKDGHIWRWMPSQFMVIEVTCKYLTYENSMNLAYKASAEVSKSLRELLKFLPIVYCLTPKETLVVVQNKRSQCMELITMEYIFKDHESFKRVFYYLQSRNSNNISIYDDKTCLNYQECLELILQCCGIDNPSWAEINNYVEFLNFQLQCSETSLFCQIEEFKGFRTFVVKLMQPMSRDFATPSISAVYDKDSDYNDVTQNLQVHSRKNWENNPHSYLFFNEDNETLTFVGISITKHGEVIEPQSQEKLGITISSDLQRALERNKVIFNEDYSKWQKSEMIQKLGNFMGVKNEKPVDPDSSYVLTLDNFIKILAIKTRLRCNIPVIIMGHTGCGKTRLIRYMCEFISKNSGHSDFVRNMLIMKIHGGINNQHIQNKIEEANALAQRNSEIGIETILFFDEANTTEEIGLIKEIMCDRRVNGVPIESNIKFVAACNPYERHPESTIQKLQNAGLGYFVGRNETKHKLGTIPLRELVYRVLDLPPSMQQYVFDFGRLSDAAEKDYIQQIVNNHLESMELSKDLSKAELLKAIVKVLNYSQLYIKQSKTEWNFISLRDIERAMVIFKWFLENHNMFDQELQKVDRYQECQAETRALILSLAVNYHARITDKPKFEEEVCSQMQSPLQKMTKEKFVDEITRFQEMLLSQMQLGENIARNAALRENVFMMVVCVELRIPLFVVGKPGSSKSLAKSIVANSMRGKASSTSLLQMFKQVQLFSYQCSKHSTPDGILEVFQQAMDYQKAVFKLRDNEDQNQERNFVSVVVLDEVGLAEDSPSLPLKVLHPLLEDGTSTDDNLATSSKVDGSKDLAIDIIPREDRVAFIGISNWALDPAKMNRGVMIIRGGTDKKELIESAGEICSSDKSDKIRVQLSRWFEKLADLFLKLCQDQEKEFFGLRDFYSIIKMLYWMMKKTLKAVPETDRSNVLTKLPTSKQLKHAILRNFSGHKEIDPFSYFNLPEMDKFEYTHNEILHNLEPDCSPLGLIKRSLSSNERDCHGESRYLLFLTENYAALRIFYQYLSDSKTAPTIIFGSSFPRDQEYTQICCNISKIKLCMETGQTVVLLQLGSLYESLYDLLNQYYSYMGSSRFVDLGLSSHRIKRKVHDNFKLVVIAEKDKVYLHEEFPTPLINRLEKHFLVMSTVLISSEDKDLVRKCLDWVKAFSCSSYNSYCFTEKDSFVGYQEDTCAAVVYSCLYENKKSSKQSSSDDSSVELKNLDWCKKELLNLATPDAVVRSKKSMEENENKLIQATYFTKQNHSCMADYLIQQFEHNYSSEGVLLQILTYGPLLSKLAIYHMLQTLNVEEENCRDFNLQQFDTELDFCNAIRPFLSKVSVKLCYGPFKVLCVQPTKLLILQCEFGDQNLDLIASVKQKIMDLKIEIAKKSLIYCSTQVALIVTLSRKPGGTRFVGFQGGQWKSVYIDDLLPPSSKVVSVENATSVKSIGDLLLDKSLYTKSDRFFNPLHKIRTRIQAAVSCIQDTKEHKERIGRRITILLKLMPTHSIQLSSNQEGKLLFQEILVQKLGYILKERDELSYDQQEWIFQEATNIKNLQEGGTLRRALNNVMDNLIDRFFSLILEFIDRYHNLDIADIENNENLIVSQLWLYLFETKSICSFSYKEIATKYASEQQRGGFLPGLGSALSTWEFKCQFPFSWKVSEIIESFEVVLNKTGERLDKTSYMKLNDMLRNGSDLGNCFNTFSDLIQLKFSDKVSLLEFYLHDFVNLKFEKLDQHEVKVLSNAIYSQALIIQPAISNENEQWSLLEAFAAIHISFHCINHQLIMFKQIAALPLLSDIVLQLKNEIEFPASEIIIAFQAVEKLLDVLKPDFKGWKRLKIQNWSLQIITSATFVSEILEFKCQSDSKASMCQERIRQTWQKLQAVYLFTDNVLLDCAPHAVIQDMAATIWISLQRGTVDFTKSKTFEKIKTTIKMKELELRKTDYSEKREQYGHFLACCNSYLMEVISTLCFGTFQINPPEASLIQYIMEIYYNSENPDLAISPFKNTSKKEGKEQIVLRSSILQLLLTFDFHLVGNHFQKYLQEIVNENHKTELKVQCVECLEDNLWKNYGHLSEIELASTCKDLLQESQEQMDKPEMFIKLEGVSKVRFSLVAGAQLLVNFINRKDAQTEEYKMRLLGYFNVMDTFCSNKNYEDGADFLVKVLVLKYGKTYLDDIFQSELGDFAWIYPERLRKQNENYAPFMIYEAPYETILQKLTDCSQFNQWNALALNLHDEPYNNGTLLTLAVYTCITLSYVTDEKDNKTEQTNKLVSLLSAEAEICSQLKSALRLLILNEQGRSLNSLSAYKDKTLKDNMLSSIIIHAMAVFYCKEEDTFLQPFTNILFHPEALKETYMPAMPEDLEYKLAKVFTDKVGMYRCPNGHVYFIGNCTKPWVLAKCDRCDAQIGGKSHELAAGNQRIDLDQLAESSKKGYDLAQADDCSEAPYSERELPTADFIAMRLIMHALLTWTVCSVKKNVELVLDAMSKKSDDPPTFFWNHLQRDLKQLHVVLHCTMEEAALLIHVILKAISQLDKKSGLTGNLSTLETRNKWEKDFLQLYVTPLVKTLPDENGEVKCAAKLSAFYTPELQDVLYEKTTDTKGSKSLWRFREQISSDHLRHTMELHKKECAKYDILTKFLSREEYLRAVQYLPDIVQLQKVLYDQFNHRKDYEETEKWTVLEYLSFLESDVMKDSIQKKICSFNKSWKLCKHEIVNLGRNAEERVILESLSEITDSTSILYLLPTKSGYGICSTNLTIYLVEQHNNFIKFCSESSDYFHEIRPNQILLTQLKEHHVMQYEKQLLDVILSHSHYSFELGKGRDIKYDYKSIEAHLVRKFVVEKPLLDLSKRNSIPLVVFKGDIFTKEMVHKITKAVSPQCPLPKDLQRSIIDELNTQQTLTHSLSVIVTVLGCLLSTGGSAETSLQDYIQETLQIKEKFSLKIRQSSTLGNILSLWELLSVENGKQHVLNGQDPFDTSFKELKKDLSDSEVKELESALQQLDVNQFLCGLYNFIVTFARFEPYLVSLSLKEMFTLCMEEEYELDEIPNGFDKVFPESILVSQAVEAWKIAAKFQKKTTSDSH